MKTQSGGSLKDSIAFFGVTDALFATKAPPLHSFNNFQQSTKNPISLFSSNQICKQERNRTLLFCKEQCDPMILQLDDKYRIVSDEHNFILQRKSDPKKNPRKGKKAKAATDQWKILGY